MREKMRHLQEQCWYGLLAGELLTMVCLYLAGPWCGIYQASFPILATAFLFAACLGVFRFLKLRGRVVWGCVLLMTGTACVVFYCGPQLREIMASYGRWLLSSGEWLEEYFVFYQVLNIAALAFFVFLFRLLCERYLAFDIAAGLGLAVCFVVCMLRETQAAHGGVVCGMVYLLLVFLEVIRRRQTVRQTCAARHAVLWLAPFLLLYLVVMAAIPARQEAFQWQFAKSAYSKVCEVAAQISQDFMRLGGGGELGLSYSGFSDEGGSFGNLLEDDREVMLLETESGLRSNVYLIGKISDTFDGREWQQTDESAWRDRELDALETLYAVKRHGASWQGNYLHQTKLKLTYRYFDTTYLFAPLKTLRVSGRGVKRDEPAVEGANLLFRERKGYGTEYEILFQQMNQSNPGFYDMVREQTQYRYGEASQENAERLHELQLLYVVRPAAEGFITEQELKQRAEEIRHVYGCPVELSEEVKRDLEEITADAGTDLDKLLALEKALSSMTYTTTPGKIPDGADFLDYFLLESREGYCSYFATAFVLLARAEGIPARYVQGFCVPTQGGEERLVSVHSGMAHAWPEAYLEGVGWIPFEPTPGYASMRYTSWEMSGSQVDWTSDDMPDDGAENAAAPLNQEIQPEEDQVREQNKGRLGKLPALLLWLAAAVILCVAGVLALDLLLGKYRYRHMSVEQQIRRVVWGSRNILTVLGYPLLEGETLEELGKRARSGLDAEASGDCPLPENFLSGYEEMIYGSRPAEELLLAEVSKERELLAGILRQRTGRRYPWYQVKLYWMNSRTEKAGEV